MKKLFIAIDGPAASGKGTIAKLLAEKLKLPVLHTGNIYRAVAYEVMKNNQDPHEVKNAVEAANKLKITDLSNPNLMEERAGEYASIIASYQEVRDITYGFQRSFIDEVEGAVIEGRDIGTVICPEANFKFYLTADAEIRAERRCAQQDKIDYNTILIDLKKRDERDLNREVAPLKPAKDAVIIDSSKLDVQSTLAEIFSKIMA